VKSNSYVLFEQSSGSEGYKQRGKVDCAELAMNNRGGRNSRRQLFSKDLFEITSFTNVIAREIDLEQMSAAEVKQVSGLQSRRRRLSRHLPRFSRGGAVET